MNAVFILFLIFLVSTNILSLYLYNKYYVTPKSKTNIDKAVEDAKEEQRKANEKSRKNEAERRKKEEEDKKKHDNQNTDENAISGDASLEWWGM